MTLFGLAGCDSCRRARRWLEHHALQFKFVDLRAQPPGETVIRDWCEEAGWRQLLNRHSTTWRQLPKAERDELGEARAVALMTAHPTLIKRPVLSRDGRIVVGFDAERYAAMFGV